MSVRTWFVAASAIVALVVSGLLFATEVVK